MEDKAYFTLNEDNGVISISPNVIAGIAERACLDTKGVSAMASASNAIHGVVVTVEEKTCSLAVYIMVDKECVIADTAKEVQKNVKSAVEAGCGICVLKSDVFVAGIELKK